MREPEYRRLRRRIQAECEEKLRALDLVFRMSGGTAAKNSEQGGRKSKGAVSEAVQNALPKLTGEFSVREIEDQIKLDDPSANFKPSSISSTLKRMAEEPGTEIECTQKGKGRQGSKYRKKK